MFPLYWSATRKTPETTPRHRKSSRKANKSPSGPGRETQWPNKSTPLHTSNVRPKQRREWGKCLKRPPGRRFKSRRRSARGVCCCRAAWCWCSEDFSSVVWRLGTKTERDTNDQKHTHTTLFLLILCGWERGSRDEFLCVGESMCQWMCENKLLFKILLKFYHYIYVVKFSPNIIMGSYAREEVHQWILFSLNKMVLFL